MATTHVFIVDVTTFRYHLEYLFVGTGSKNDVVDFNNNQYSELHSTTERNLIGLMADFSRVRIGDLVIFYVQQNNTHHFYEGKFYGVFKITSLPFLDNNENNGNNQFLKRELGKSLTFRAKIEPYQVYAHGVTEWQALDDIGNTPAPHQMLWSLIYRKLKGNRGNTMISLYESEKLIGLLRQLNERRELDFNNFSFDVNSQKIINSDHQYPYDGRMEQFNILPRLIEKHDKNHQFESHLQSYILKNLENISIFSNENIEWIGNEVSCGVGMQRIDIMVGCIDDRNNRKIIPIELKSTPANNGITKQLQRYVDWLNLYYIPNTNSDIEPMVIARKINDKECTSYQSLIASFSNFNRQNNFRLRYVEFEISNNQINFNEVNY